MKRISSDGKLLEYVIYEVCSGIENAKVSHNVKIESKSMSRKRQVDIFIEGKIGAFDIKIEVEAKDYAKPVSVTQVESFASKIQDTGMNLGVMVSKKGFTQSAIERARFLGIQIFKAISDKLGNSNLLLPLRCIICEIEKFSVKFKHRGGGNVNLPLNIEDDIRILKDQKEYNVREFLISAWNDGKVPQEEGNHDINFDAIVVKNSKKTPIIQYFECIYQVKVVEKYYARLEPVVYIQNLQNSKKNYKLHIPLYNSDEEMKKHRKHFSSLKEMNESIEIEKQPENIRDLIIRPYFNYNI